MAIAPNVTPSPRAGKAPGQHRRAELMERNSNTARHHHRRAGRSPARPTTGSANASPRQPTTVRGTGIGHRVPSRRRNTVWLRRMFPSPGAEPRSSVAAKRVHHDAWSPAPPWRRRSDDTCDEYGQQRPPDQVGRRRGVLNKRAGYQRTQRETQGWERAGDDGCPLAARRLQIDQCGADRPAGQTGCNALHGRAA